jgi:hypothetical protein
MATVVDFADALDELSEGQDLLMLISEISAILGRKYDTLDTNTRSEDYNAWMEMGSRTEVSWPVGVTLVFEPDAKVPMTLVISELWSSIDTERYKILRSIRRIGFRIV